MNMKRLNQRGILELMIWKWNMKVTYRMNMHYQLPATSLPATNSIGGKCEKLLNNTISNNAFIIIMQYVYQGQSVRYYT